MPLQVRIGAGGGIWPGMGPPYAETVLPRGVQYVASSGHVLAVRCLQRISFSAPEQLFCYSTLQLLSPSALVRFFWVWKVAGGACQRPVQVVAPSAAYMPLACLYRDSLQGPALRSQDL